MTRELAISFVVNMALGCLAALLLGAAVLEILDHFDAPPPPILVDPVRAGMQLCTPVRPSGPVRNGRIA